MSEFTWAASFSTELSMKPEVTIVKFGDGYEKRFGGLNNALENWNLTFDNFSTSDANAIMDFFSTRAGYKRFSWTNPRGVEKYYVCEEWSQSYSSYNVNTIKAKFRQVVA
jgi:phage-related protein